MVKIGTSLTIIVSALISIFLVDAHASASFAIPAAMMVLVADLRVRGSVIVLAFPAHELRDRVSRHDPGAAGGLTLPAGLAFLVAAMPMALLAERSGRVRTIALGMVICLAGLVLATAVTTPLDTAVALCLASAGTPG